MKQKLMMKFTCVCTISLNFKIYFLSFPWEIVFGVISGDYIYLQLQKMQKNCKILKIILVLIFVHLKQKLLDFLSDFVLIAWHSQIFVFITRMKPRRKPKLLHISSDLRRQKDSTWKWTEGISYCVSLHKFKAVRKYRNR